MLYIVFQTLFFFAFIDYSIYKFYLKQYNIKLEKEIDNDLCKYRLILRSILWSCILLYTYKCNYNLYDTFLYGSLISFIIFIIEKIFNYKYYNSLYFICADTIINTLIINFLIFIILLFK